jgi:hypothetical protein
LSLGVANAPRFEFTSAIPSPTPAIRFWRSALSRKTGTVACSSCSRARVSTTKLDRPDRTRAFNGAISSRSSLAQKHAPAEPFPSDLEPPQHFVRRTEPAPGQAVLDWQTLINHPELH